jgi:hypothetical protein
MRLARSYQAVAVACGPAALLLAMFSLSADNGAVLNVIVRLLAMGILLSGVYIVLRSPAGSLASVTDSTRGMCAADGRRRLGRLGILAVIELAVAAIGLLAAQIGSSDGPKSLGGRTATSTSLAEVSGGSAHIRTGTVDREPVPPSPTLEFQGLGCPVTSATLVADLRRRFSQLTVQVALDDAVPISAHAQVAFLSGDNMLGNTIVDRGAGKALTVDLHERDQVRIIATALSHAEDDCGQLNFQVHLLDGVLREGT